jgi:hypothetical protein
MWSSCAKDWLELNAAPMNANHNSYVVVSRGPYYHIILEHQCELGVPITVMGDRYGGPAELAKYRGVIVIPYQFSVMSMWEYLSHGIMCFVPTKRLFLELVPSTCGVGITRESLQYAEWYVPEHENLFFFFDSWSHLAELLLTVDAELHRDRLVNFSRGRIKLVLEQWRQILLGSVSKPI